MKFNPIAWLMGIVSALVVGGGLAWASTINSKVDKIGEILGELKQINYRLEQIEKRMP